MRDFHTVVGIDRIDVLNGRYDVTVRGVIAFEFVGDEPTRLTVLPLDETTEEAFSSLLVASPLDKNINGIPYGQKTHAAL